MGKKGLYNYADFGNTGSGGGNTSTGVFGRVGNQNSFQALADSSSPAPGRIAFGSKGGQQTRPNSNPFQNAGQQQPFGQNSNAQNSTGRSQQNRGQVKSSVKDQIVESLAQHTPKWRLSCFSVAESASREPGAQTRSTNEVNGDVSFEEVRWADYQTPDKSICAPRFAQAITLKNQQYEALKRCQKAPSEGGPTLPEAPSPYLDPQQPVAQAPASGPAPFGAPQAGSFGVTQASAFGGSGAQQQPFGMPNQPSMDTAAQPSQPGRLQFGQKAGHSGTTPFGSASSQQGRVHFGSAAGQSNSNPSGRNSAQSNLFSQPNSAQSNPFGQTNASQSNLFGQPNATSFTSVGHTSSSQPNPFGQGAAQAGRMQFGSKAGQPAAAFQHPAAPQAVPAQPFRKPFDSTEDPFGRDKPNQAAASQQPAAQHSDAQQSFGFGQQQQPPATPAPFGFGQQQQPQQAQGDSQAFQTPAVQQRPAFAGGIAVSPTQDGAAPAPDKAAHGQDAAQQQASGASPWALDDFVIGKIPEDPPPFELCH